MKPAVASPDGPSTREKKAPQGVSFNPGRPDLVRRVHADASYCSANDLRVFFGLGDDDGPQTVVVRWPGGVVSETFRDLPARSFSELREGTAAP